MKTYNYNWEVKNLVTLFINALNDVIIKRYDDTHLSHDDIHVNFRYSPKTRTLHDLVNKNMHLQLPIISCYITGITREVGRVFNNIEGSYWNLSPQVTGSEHMLQPLPVKIKMGVSIIGRYQTDIDQIIDNIFVWFDPYIVVSSEVPFFPHEMRACIMWDEHISMEYPLDIDATKPYRIVGNTSFDILGWLYKPSASPIGKIYKIDTSFIAVSNVYFDDFEMMATQRTPETTDFFTISARPFVSKIIPYLALTGTPIEFALYGNMFQFTSGIFVSGSPGVFPVSQYVSAVSAWTWGESFVDIFSSFPKLSATYPGFSAAPITAWEVQGEKSLTFTMPSAANIGFVNVIVWNEAGYGQLTVDSLRQTFNPYDSSMPEYSTWVNWQPPYISGVEITQLP